MPNHNFIQASFLVFLYYSAVNLSDQDGVLRALNGICSLEVRLRMLERMSKESLLAISSMNAISSSEDLAKEIRAAISTADPNADTTGVVQALYNGRKEAVEAREANELQWAQGWKARLRSDSLSSVSTFKRRSRQLCWPLIQGPPSCHACRSP